MRIGIDAQTILNPEMGDAAGLGHYTYQIIKNLLKIDNKNDYVIFVNYRLRNKDFDKVLRYKNVKVCRFPFSKYKKFVPLVYSETFASAFFMKEKLDVLFVPGGRVPIDYRGRIVTTSYNLAINKHPDLFPRREIIKYRLKSPAYKRSDRVIAFSDSGKKDLEDLFYLDSEKIKVVSSAFDEKFYQEVSQNEVDSIKNKYGIDGEYILFMNTIKPLNNLARLIESFSKLKILLENEEGGAKYKLVLAGKNGWLSDEIHQIAKDFGLSREVIFPGYIKPEDLNALFGGAKVFVSVPIYEEFGSIVLEAFASKLPVVCSDIPSYRELAQGAAKFVNPYDIDGISEAILDVARNSRLSEEMKEKGFVRSKDFSWKKSAQETLKILEEVGNK